MTITINIDDPYKDMPRVEPLGLVEEGAQGMQAGAEPDPGQQAAGVAQQLSERDQSIAWLDAFGVAPAVVETRMGLIAGTVLTLRAKPEYRAYLQVCLREKARTMVEQAGTIEDLFNDQIAPSVAALIEVRDNPYAKDTARVKAATQFLDRAPKAPKARKEVDERSVVIHLPASELDNMKQALIDEGTEEDLEMVELIEGKARQWGRQVEQAEGG